MSAPTPKEDDSQEEYAPAKILAKFDEIDKVLKNTQQRVKIWQDTTSLTVIVIFVAALALVFTLVFFFIQTINSDIQSRRDLTEAVQELKIKLDTQK